MNLTLEYRTAIDERRANVGHRFDIEVEKMKRTILTTMQTLTPLSMDQIEIYVRDRHPGALHIVFVAALHELSAQGLIVTDLMKITEAGFNYYK